jgi:hypothetical protein
LVLEDASLANREALRDFLTAKTTVWAVLARRPGRDEGLAGRYSIDDSYLVRPGADEVHLDLFGDSLRAALSSSTATSPVWVFRLTADTLTDVLAIR